MSGLQRRRKDDVQKPFPGYMGRSTSIVGTKLPSEKAYRDGSAVRRTEVDPVDIHQEDKLAVSESRKSSPGMKVDKSPMKMLIAQELSKEMDVRRKPPSLVARLMGLDDSLPSDPSFVSTKRSLQDSVLEQSSSGGTFQAANFNRLNLRDINLCHSEKNGYCDIYEVRQRPSGPNCFKDQALPKCQHNENQIDKRMALVRQKFTEAKRLAADENLLESKEFHEALEVLSSNQDLFLKFLEEPNSLFSKRYRQLQSILPPLQTRRITVLKPTKTIQTKDTNQMEQQVEGGWEMQRPLANCNYSQRVNEKLSHPTRIVVLKPCARKIHDMKNPTGGMPSPEPPVCGDKVAKETYGSLSRHRRDESLLSSIFSNGYVGDDSSFTRSEDYVEEGDSTFSDSEIAPGTLRNSWDYINNRSGSPYLHSPLCRASYSPESAVIREAKKRLSERWSLVASNVPCMEQLREWRSSSTLGEMLAIPELKREDKNDKHVCVSGSRLYSREDCAKIGKTRDENEREISSGNLSRSKSMPTFSASYENITLNVVDPDSKSDKPVDSMVMTKCKGGKSSFKGRVSSLFFLKNKKAGREKSVSSPLESSKNGDIPCTSVDTADKKFGDLSQVVQVGVPEEIPAGNSEASPGRISAQVSRKEYPDVFDISPKATLLKKEPTPAGEKLDMPRISEKENQSEDHPSPTSILDAPFKDDKAVNADNPQALSRSSPIESISRTLSWGNCSLEGSLPNPLKLSRAFSKGVEDDAEDLLFVQNLLSASRLCRKKLNNIFKYWHSPESPLDPHLLDKFLDHKDEGAKIRERRSNQKLVFDCVNDVLLEMDPAGNQEENSLASVVWDLVRKKMSSYCCKPAAHAMTDNGSQIVDELIRKEVTGSEWLVLMRSEADRISEEFSDSIFDDLVREVSARSAVD
ncbi:hypothetical protein AXF42_Ash007687 [Apostasia shenzhenica]|uniref:DUF3741 domain-containing protein n=1 Tax=Apostasia shenzhenica TaxID=1088818 RepID=A0A2I0A657_9ASPA|nr:hypothetical protein AXF42_Ash007687 [Apostasia shenzhenica]